jgi:hypothetical protein
VPYQLQTLAQLLDVTELLLLVLLELEVLVARLAEVLLLVAILEVLLLVEVATLVAALAELVVAELVETRTELATLLVTPPHKLPVTAGSSIAPPFLAPWKPNSSVCAGAILPFQLRLVAV